MKEMEYKIVDVDKLLPNPYEPRKVFDGESIRELSNSLKSRGEIEPIIVRRREKGYQIIAGGRRWDAAKKAGMKKIPVLIRDIPEEDVLLDSLIENVHRKDLESVERENAVFTLWNSGRWKTREELAKVLGKSVPWVQQNIGAAEIRRKEKVVATIPTKTIIDTIGLEKEDRTKIIELVEKEEIPEKEVREYARVVKEAPPVVKKAVLKPKTRITPRIAKRMIELELPEPKQVEIIKEIETYRLEEEEALPLIERAKEIEIKLPPPEEWEEIRKRYEELQQEIKSRLETPEAKERGKLFRNWAGHIAVSGALGSMICPVCGSKQLGWICDELEIKEALKEAEEKYKQSMKGKK